MRDHDIVLFAPDPWGGIWRNRHQIFTRLARDNRIVWVEPRSATLTHLWRRCRAGEWRNPAFWKFGVSQPMANVWVVHTPQFAPTTRGGIGTITRAIREAPIRSLLRRLGVRHPLLWLFHPSLADEVGRWDERLAIYHLVDEYTAYTKNPSVEQSLAADERDLLAKVDMVFVTSQKLLESKSALHPKVHLVPNGVDYRAFAGALPDATLARLPRPVLGYVGALKGKIDFTLLRKVADANPDGTVLLVGPRDAGVDEDEWRALVARPNVRFEDARPVADVPGIVAACDVGLLPYRRMRWTENINSLKLNEYLAAGLPVVAIDLPMVADARELLYVARDEDEFVRRVREARDSLTAPGEADRREARRRYASGQDWDSRVSEIGTHVLSELARAGAA